MVEKLHEEEIPKELRGIFPSYYRCTVCGCIFNDKKLAEDCESRNMLEFLSRT